MPIAEAAREFPRPDPKLRAKIASGEMSRQEMQRAVPDGQAPGADRHRAAGREGAARRDERAPARRSDGRFLVQPLQRVRRQGRRCGGTLAATSARRSARTRSGRSATCCAPTAQHPGDALLPRQLAQHPAGLRRAGGTEPRTQARGLNENYARELMELHTLGVDGGYTQKDVTEVARASPAGRSTGRTTGRRASSSGRGMHDRGEKIVLGQRDPGRRRRGRRRAGARYPRPPPATARFIATKLVRRFVARRPAARAGRARGRALPRAPTATSAPCCGRSSTSPEFFGAGRVPGQDQDAVRVRGRARCARSAARRRAGRHARSRARSAEIGEPLYEAQPPTGYADTRRGLGEPRRAAGRMNFALGSRGPLSRTCASRWPPLVAGADRARRRPCSTACWPDRGRSPDRRRARS